MISFKENDLFRNASNETLELITRKNRKKKHTFLIPTKYISPECAQVGYLLNRYFNWQKDSKNSVGYRSFFCNSRFEAMQGAIKIARHKSGAGKSKNGNIIFLHDPASEYKHFIDPLENGVVKGFIPGIKLFPTIKEIEQSLLQGEKPSAVALCPCNDESMENVAGLLSLCRSKKIITIMEQSDLDITSPETLVHQIPCLPDIIITGESLTDYQIPFGAFSMSREINAPWSQITTCYVHSSTYGGNSLSAARVRDRLLNHAPCIQSNDAIKDKCSAMALSDSERLEAFAEYVNPGLVGLYALTGLDIQPVQAHGSMIEIETSNGNKKTIVDCISGGGTAVRGHTPPDIIPEVIETHDPEKDYWKELGEKFRDLMWPHVFPAISGATAVDIGMALSLIANPLKTKIVVFKNNYAGKTLLSINGSEDKIWRKPFSPLYHDVHYIDPFADEAKRNLKSVIETGEVALIWFELIQGNTGKQIPDDLIDIIREYKKDYDYIIGIDEVLMGLYRAGSLFAHKDKNLTPDVVTLAKQLSDGTFPFAVTLASSDVYQKALANNPDVVHYYEKLYKNQLGSHIAGHSMDKMLDPEFSGNLKKVSEILNKGLNELAQRSPLLKEVSGKGHFYQFYYNDKHPVFMVTGELGRSMFMMYMCRLMVKKADVFLFFDRCLPSLSMTENEARLFLQKLESVFVTQRPSFLYLRFSGFMFKVISCIVLDSLKHITRQRRK